MFRKKRTQKYKVIGSKPKKIVVSLLTSVKHFDSHVLLLYDIEILFGKLKKNY